MADNIQQKFGIDANQAISTLRALDAGFAKLESRLRSTAAVIGQFNSGSRKLSEFASNTKRDLSSAGRSVDDFTKKASRGAQTVTVSWQTLSRVFQTQVLLRTMNLFRDAVREAVTEINEFELATARMSTIAQGPGSSIRELQSSLSDLSAELGRPIDEISSAAYEALQNDLGTTAETMDLLSGAAHDLALVTGSDLTASINSLSSVMKSYNLPASEASDITDIFFTAIDKGRISLDQLESRLGTVTPLAATLGVNFDESAAAVASLTLSGLNSATAMTQLRNLLQKLVKPTDDLKAAFERLGVTSGTELIQRFGGLQGALGALRQAFNNNDQAVARAFGTIRGQLGVLNLLANEGTNFNKVLRAMEGRAGRTEEAVKKIDSVTTRQLQKEIQQARKTLRSLGKVAQEVQLDLLQVFNALTGDSGPSPENIESERVSDIKKSAELRQKELDQEIKLINDKARLEQQTNILTGQAGDEVSALLEVQRLVNIEQAKINRQHTHAGELIRANIRATSELGLLLSQTGDQGAIERGGLLQETVGGEIGRATSSQELAQIREILDLFEERVKAETEAGIIQEEGQNILNDTIGILRQQVNAQELLQNLKGQQGAAAQAQLEIERELEQRLENALQASEGSEQATGNLSTNVGGAVTKTSQLVIQAQQVAKAFQEAATAAASLGGAPSATAAFGGFFGHGGRGPDTIPAFLRKGEHVTQPRAAANFAAELQAINANQTPVFRDRGGSVTNVGDVNVNVTTDSTRGIDARQVAQQIRREIRRGTISSL